MPWHTSLLLEVLGWAGQASGGSSIGWRAYCCQKQAVFLSRPLPGSYTCGRLLLAFVLIFSANSRRNGSVSAFFDTFLQALWFLSSVAVEKGSLERLKIAISCAASEMTVGISSRSRGLMQETTKFSQIFLAGSFILQKTQMSRVHIVQWCQYRLLTVFRANDNFPLNISVPVLFYRDRRLIIIFLKLDNLENR